MVYFLNKILPCDLYNIIHDILITTYINKYINIQMWNINLITDKYIYNKHLIRQQINYINENIRKLYTNHFIKYGIKNKYISNNNLFMLNKLLEWCNNMSNHINIKYNPIQLSNGPYNYNLTELYILEKINNTINIISKNDLSIHINLKKQNRNYNNKPINNVSIITTQMNQLTV